LNRPAVSVKNLFTTPIRTKKHYLLILVVALCFIFLPQNIPTDWDLNTTPYPWDWLNAYQNENYVYPPWALIMLFPYYLMRSTGARILSVLVFGAWAKRRGFTLLQFFAFILSPYFLVTMKVSNVDILAILLPIYLWEISSGKRWEPAGLSLAMALAVVKPQAMVFLMPYWIWQYREKLSRLIVPFITLILLIVPISLVGTPPLILQWIDNIRNPSEQNAGFWSVNNVSLWSRLSPLAVVILVALVGLLIYLYFRKKSQWTPEHTLATLLFSSMLLSPYTSQQSLSAAFAMVPSWGITLLQVILIPIGIRFFNFYEDIPFYVLFMAVAAILFYRRKQPSNIDHLFTNLV
jgi:hypothetical protein